MYRYYLLSMFASCLLLLSVNGYAGDITGKIAIQSGMLDSPKPISPFARARGEISHPEIANGSGIVVYLEADPHLSPNQPDQRPVMDQVNYTITPHVLPVCVGTTVKFPNSDQVYHNLFSLSSAKKFDLGRYPKGVYKEVTFDKPGEVRIYCDIHPSMSGVILVVPNRYFTQASDEGTYSIENVPAGTYTITAWHEQLSELERTAVVPETGSVIVDFVYKNR